MTNRLARAGWTVFLAAPPQPHSDAIATCRDFKETPPALWHLTPNHGAHKEPHVKAWLKKGSRFICHFMPTSSSWLNLVERWFEELR